VAKNVLPKLEIEELIEILLTQIRIFDVEAARGRNLIDPFATLIERFEFDFGSKSEWESSEFARQRQKNLMNKIGDLHQRIIGRLDGWECHESGTGMPDVIGLRGNQKIIAEVKNKHNTMSDGAKKGAYKSLAEMLSDRQFRGYVGVVVQIIGPRERSGNFWKPFTASGCVARNDIIVMNGRTFYAIATDSQMRQPNLDFGPTENLRQWPTWGAIDEMVEQFFAAVENLYGGSVPRWVRELVPQALSN
jgi:hypothetical protein